MIDGFPRSVDQAQYFEQSMGELQQIIHVDVEIDELSIRLEARCKISDRLDDNLDIIKKRLNAYNDQTLPCIDYYTKFGKVRNVKPYDSKKMEQREDSHIWSDIKNALLPQIMFIVGPTKSGKTTLGNTLAERTNISQINFG